MIRIGRQARQQTVDLVIIRRAVYRRRDCSSGGRLLGAKCGAYSAVAIEDRLRAGRWSADGTQGGERRLGIVQVVRIGRSEIGEIGLVETQVHQLIVHCQIVQNTVICNSIFVYNRC